MSKKIEYLTEEQEKMMIDYRDSVLSKVFDPVERNKPIDTDKVTSLIKSLYKFCEIKTDPEVIFVDSPLAAQIMANYFNDVQVWKQVSNQVSYFWSQVSNQVDNQVSKQVLNQVVNKILDPVLNKVLNQVLNRVLIQVSNLLSQVSDQLWSQVDNQVLNNLMNQVKAQVLNQSLNRVLIQFEKQVLNQVSKQVWNQVSNKILNLFDNQIWNQVSSQVLIQFEKQVSNQFRNQVDSQVSNQVGQIVGQILNKLWNQFRNQVLIRVVDQVCNQLLSQVSDQVDRKLLNQIRNNNELKFYSFSGYGNISDLGWVSFYNFFKKIGVDLNASFFTEFTELVFSGIYDMIQFENLVIVCSMPEIIERDNQYNLHCKDGYAIKWKDGYGQCYIHGVSVPDSWIFNGVTIDDILNESNAERKRVAIDLYGYGKFIEDSGAKAIDEWSSYKLYEFPEEMKILECLDSTPENFDEEDDESSAVIRTDNFRKGEVCIPGAKYKRYFLRVPPDMKRVKEAVAWTYYMTEEEYDKSIEFLVET